ncbi:MAG: DMT family transporter [Aestuariibaculum sp.]
MKNQHSKNLIVLTLATFIISTSGPLGRYIDLPTPVIIWSRCFIAGIVLFGFIKYKKISLAISKKDIVLIAVSSLFMGAHWITYFYALKFSNVALGLLSLFAYPIITALLEPLFIKIKFDPIYILLGFMVLLGIYILAPEFSLENQHVKGILFGLLSAFFYAIRNILSKKLTLTYNGSSIMFFQIAIVVTLLLPVLFYMDTSGIVSQWPYLLLLGILTTAIGHTMLVNSLKHFSVSTASIINSTQPIFGIILAYIFLNEKPALNTIIGGSIILATVIIESYRSRKHPIDS